MPAYQHVLAAIDLGEQSERVVERAADVALRYSAAISLLHVTAFLPSFELGGELVLPPYPDIEQALLRNAQSRLDALAKNFKIEPPRAKALIGTPRAEILRYAREQQVDLIVVGRHGRHGLGSLIGSTANAILNGAACDVLAVTTT
jgi:universal stress protein A